MGIYIKVKLICKDSRTGMANIIILIRNISIMGNFKMVGRRGKGNCIKILETLITIIQVR